ncbi:MAG: helix-turn-helix domain-containing protein [Deltaproteobacteria bacterium]
MDQYIQEIINQIKGFINIEFGFCDISGIILGCSDQSKMGSFDHNISAVLESGEDVCIVEEYVYQKYYRDGIIDFIAFIRNPNQDAINYINAISICIINLKKIKENYTTRLNFISEIIKGEVAISDINNKARELQLINPVTRVIFLVKVYKPSKNNISDIIQSIFPNRNSDFVIKLDEYSTALVKELYHKEELTPDKIAAIILDTLNSEIMIKAYVGIGGTFDNIVDIVRSFEQAQAAVSVGEIFYPDRFIINYNRLGLGRLICQIPRELAQAFLDEIFTDAYEEVMNEETVGTINKLFENNLHISEASRQLYLHRNTLVYRLEKIQKSIGLDLKKFDDAVIFKIALLIREYLDKTSRNR